MGFKVLDLLLQIIQAILVIIQLLFILSERWKFGKNLSNNVRANTEMSLAVCCLSFTLYYSFIFGGFSVIQVVFIIAEVALTISAAKGLSNIK